MSSASEVLENQKQRIDRLAAELKVLSDIMEALVTLDAVPFNRIGVTLTHPQTGDVLGEMMLSPTALLGVARSEADWRIAAMNQDDVRL